MQMSVPQQHYSKSKLIFETTRDPVDWVLLTVVVNVVAELAIFQEAETHKVKRRETFKTAAKEFISFEI